MTDTTSSRARCLDYLTTQAGPDGIVPPLDRGAVVTALGTTEGTLGWMLWSLIEGGALERVRRGEGGNLPVLKVTGRSIARTSGAGGGGRIVMERQPGALSVASVDRLRTEYGIEIGETRLMRIGESRIPVTLARVSA